MHEEQVFYFFYENVKEIVRAKTRDVSSMHYNWIKHMRDVCSVLYGTIMSLN